MNTDPEAIEIEPKKYTRKVVARSYVLSPGDVALLAYCQEFLGCSASEVVRSAIRAYATSLESISRARI